MLTVNKRLHHSRTIVLNCSSTPVGRLKPISACVLSPGRGLGTNRKARYVSNNWDNCSTLFKPGNIPKHRVKIKLQSDFAGPVAEDRIFNTDVF